MTLIGISGSNRLLRCSTSTRLFAVQHLCRLGSLSSVLPQLALNIRPGRNPCVGRHAALPMPRAPWCRIGSGCLGLRALGLNSPSTRTSTVGITWRLIWLGPSLQSFADALDHRGVTTVALKCNTCCHYCHTCDRCRTPCPDRYSSGASSLKGIEKRLRAEIIRLKLLEEPHA